MDVEVVYTTDNLAFNEVVGDYSLVIDTISGPEEGVLGMTTVRMYIQTENADDFISAVAGDVVNPTGIRTSTSFYQNALGWRRRRTARVDLLEAADPLVAFAYDSWVTIGIEEMRRTRPRRVKWRLQPSVGDWGACLRSGRGPVAHQRLLRRQLVHDLPEHRSEWRAHDHRVLLGQFTTDGQMSGQLFVQVFPNGVGARMSKRMSFTFGDCAEDDDTPGGQLRVHAPLGELRGDGRCGQPTTPL